jgi:hypothetical protein
MEPQGTVQLLLKQVVLGGIPTPGYHAYLRITFDQPVSLDSAHPTVTATTWDIRGGLEDPENIVPSPTFDQLIAWGGITTDSPDRTATAVWSAQIAEGTLSQLQALFQSGMTEVNAINASDITYLAVTHNSNNALSDIVCYISTHAASAASTGFLSNSGIIPGGGQYWVPGWDDSLNVIHSQVVSSIMAPAALPSGQAYIVTIDQISGVGTLSTIPSSTGFENTLTVYNQDQSQAHILQGGVYGDISYDSSSDILSVGVLAGNGDVVGTIAINTSTGDQSFALSSANLNVAEGTVIHIPGLDLSTINLASANMNAADSLQQYFTDMGLNIVTQGLAAPFANPDGSINVQYLASPSQPNTIIVGQDTATALTFDPVTGMPGSYTGTAYNLSSSAGDAFLLAA